MSERISKIRKIGVMTSGGDSPGMNAAIRAVVRASYYYGFSCCGIRMGYDGLINDKVVDLDPRSVRNLINRGGTELKSARSLEFRTVEGRAKAYQTLIKHSIDALIIIGGDGSFTGASIFQKEHKVPFIGIPGTIDNDISGTDFTVGYDTALNTAVDAIDKIRDTATSHNRVFFVEVMGRDAGFIALNSGIATGAVEILIPEKKDSIDDLFCAFDLAKKTGKTSSVVVVAEGDKLGGVYDLAKFTKMKYPEFDIKVTVLGHIQRGGSPTVADRVLASRLGVAAVEGLKEGKSNVMVGMISNKIVFTPIDQALQTANEIDKDLIKIAEILAT